MKMRTVVMAVCMGIAACLFAQGTARLLPPVANGETSSAEGGETVVVAGRGVGASKVEALKDAYRDAIEKAVGLFVDAEQMVKNDELVSEQILTHSNAYIQKYVVTKESTGANGLVTLRILATVKKSALVKKLSDVMPSQTFKLGNDAQNLHAQVVTQEKRKEDAASLLKKALDGVNPITQLIRFSLADPKMLTKDIRVGSDEEPRACYFYRFKFELDEQKYYTEFLPPLLKVLEQISVSRPKTVRLQKVASFVVNRRFMQLDNIEDINGLDNYSHLYHVEGTYDECITLGTANASWRLSDGQSCHFLASSSPFESFKRSNNEFKRLLEAKLFTVMVITQMNTSRTSVKALCYELPEGCAEVILRWQNDLLRKRTAYNIILRDKDNEDLLVRSISFRNEALINAMAGRGKQFKVVYDEYGRPEDGFGWYVTPMIHTDSKSLQRWIGFDIPRDDLPKVATISIELADEVIEE